MNDEKWMEIAIQEALIAETENEVPVGAILVKDSKLIARTHNQPIFKNDPCAHAEIQLLRAAGREINNYRLINTTIYVTLEPCIMCLGAIINARVSKIVFGAYDLKTGACGSCINLTNAKCFNHKIDVKGGVLENKCKAILQRFFKNRR
jgi:tRNA(adenine34) deaminase